MYKITQVVVFVFLILLFLSCKGQINTIVSCKKKFKEARDLAYANPTRPSALDSALVLTDECLQCDSIRNAIVDFKITLLVSMKKYSEGISFIDSLKENDFTFGYKKNLMSKNLKALDYGSKNDTVKQSSMYKEIAHDIEQYINKQNIGDKEFEEIYTDLYVVKGNYLKANQINKEIEALKKIYPEKEFFFDFFIK